MDEKFQEKQVAAVPKKTVHFYFFNSVFTVNVIVIVIDWTSYSITLFIISLSHIAF